MRTNRTRTAGCCCGQLNITVEGEPTDVYGCACRMCQRASGSAFAYTALFAEEAVLAIEGEYRAWHRRGESGGWVEQCFCPVCGSPVFGRAEAQPGIVQISVGCFADADFEPPRRLYWAGERHAWMRWPTGTDLIERQ